MKDHPRSFTFQLLGGSFAIVRRDPDSPLPGWATKGDFFSITRTDDELSIVCRMEQVPHEVKNRHRWSCLKLLGPFAFSRLFN